MECSGVQIEIRYNGPGGSPQIQRHAQVVKYLSGSRPDLVPQLNRGGHSMDQ
jgi:hypothetical protein